MRSPRPRARKPGACLQPTASPPEFGVSAAGEQRLGIDHWMCDPDRVGKVLSKRKPDDWPAAALWAFAASRASLFVASGWPTDVTEELFATPVASAAEVQRLIDAASRVLVIPDAHRTFIELE